ncbi:UxaA family hydrolase [Massilimaliae timonensis]|uniref:UxaA family hydrolase n=1 Tax=Massiliimalia timonensis TaxID=1987501 RepID=A0A8J6TVV4_9FIRM|nr:UxaA family hydrolase [Massiliimalia timonensis]MBC8611788.1 UxaA family hydrolase [Massiliimalia timonensis]
MDNAVIIEAKDNVAVAIEPIPAGVRASFCYPDGKQRAVNVCEDIAIYHKFAVCDIPCGSKIIKYGEHIGEASRDILTGEHVHVHNVASVRENLEKEESL